MNKIFETILREGYKENSEDAEFVRGLNKEDIEAALDCQILAGPFDDKTGPCFCIDDGDQEIKILYTSDIVEAMRNGEGCMVIGAWSVINRYQDRLFDGVKDYDLYSAQTSNGKCGLIVCHGASNAAIMTEEVVDIEEQNYSNRNKIYVIAVTTEVEHKLNYGGYGYDVGDITFDKVPAKANSLKIPQEILNKNHYTCADVMNTTFELTSL